MSDRSPAAQPPSSERRDRAVEELCGHFAAGHLELEALEERLTAVERATSEAELGELVADLPSLPAVSEAPVPAAPAAAALSEPRAARGWTLALMGGNSRRGLWRPPRRLNAIAVMGGVELDFRKARLPAGETHVTAIALMGGIEILVPPGLPVTVRGLGILGGVDQVEHAAETVSPDTPQLKITAFACMGGVGIQTRASEDAES